MLRREDPEHFLKFQDDLRSLIEKGVPAGKFWDLFVQCTACQYVMPRQYFPYYHPCIVQVVHPQLGLPRALPPPIVPQLPSDLEPEDGMDDIDDSDLPGPASSDDNLRPDAVARYCALLQYTQDNPAEPVTPKARRSAI